MPENIDLTALRATAGALTGQMRVQRDAVAAARRTLVALDRQAAAGEDPAVITRKRRAATDALTRAQVTAGAAADRLREQLDRLRGDPCDCASAVPLLLLPVRIETRFATPAGGQGAVLRVRIFPDTVHIDSLRRALNPNERAAGIAYWTALWPGEAGTAPWTNLKIAVGARRAAWVAESTRPTNAAAAPGGAPAFPDPAENGGDSVVARLLPDRFVAVARQGGTEFRATGKPIATEPEMGVFLPDEDEAELIDVNGVKVSPNSQWIVDFDKAVDAGLALTIALPSDRTVEELYVFGIRRSLDPAASAAALGALLDAHRHASGFGFVAQGTATNNLDDSRAGWDSGGSDSGPALDGPASGGVNGDALAHALGLDPALFAGVDNAALAEDALAQAANAVVWSGSIETFLDSLEATGGQGGAAVISDSDREALRRLHRDMVRGRGPLPAVRIGKQPYGILPVGATASLWEEKDRFLGKALPLVRNARALWAAEAANLPHIDPGQGSDDKTMVELLGMSPVSLGVRAREAYGTDWGKYFGQVTGAVDTEEELAALLAGLMVPLPGNLMIHTMPAAVLGESRPIGLPYVDASDADALAALATGQKRPIKSVLQALAQLAWSQASGRVDRNGPFELIETVLANVPDLPAASAAKVRDVGPTISNTPAAKLLDTADNLVGNLTAGASIAAYQPDHATRTSYAALAVSSTTAAGRKEFGQLAIPEWFLGWGVKAELVDALNLLAAEPSLGRRRIAFAEALDTASHRIDAWATALVESRRRTLRAKTPTGIQVGAFGWVQGISKQNKGDSGYLHAPSMGQAVTAGILRSAYLSHNADGDAASDGAFAIDLSSARVRDAMDLLDAVREGQGLSSALGYRVERGLHDAKLDRLVLNLRALAPLAAGRLVDAGQPPDPDIAAHIAIANVVDGVALIEKAKADFNVIITAANTPPPANPYVDGSAWPTLTTGPGGEEARLRAIIAAAAASLDAVSDLLVAESVHQLAQGNMPRAAAAIDAAASGDSPVPVPAVVATPAAGAQVTHRLLLVVQSGDGWQSTTPRAVAEPMLECWAAARLGPAASIVVTADGAQKTLKDTGLAALDIVYGSTDPLALAAIVRRRLGLPADAVLVNAPDAAWPVGKRAFGDVVQAAAALRTVLAAASPAMPDELGLPPDPDKPAPRAIDPASFAEAFGRATAARAVLSGHRAALDAGLSATPIDPDAVAAALSVLADFGIIAPAGSNSVDIARLAVDQAAQRLAIADALIAEAGAPDMARLNKLAVALFGDGFWILPLIAPVPGATPDEWDAAVAQRATLASPAAIRRWLADTGSVRDPVARYGDTLLLADVLDTVPALSALQVAARGIPQPGGWIGAAAVDGIASAYVVEAVGWIDPTQPAAMLVLDHFVERLPGGDELTSAVAFNAPSPNARPPQAWLLAIAPTDKNWTTDSVLATLRDTVDLAKVRGVALEHQPYVARILPALYQQSWSLRGEDVVDFSKFTFDASLVASASAALYPMRFVKES